MSNETILFILNSYSTDLGPLFTSDREHHLTRFGVKITLYMYNTYRSINFLHVIIERS